MLHVASDNRAFNKQVSALSLTSDSSGVFEENDQSLQFPLETDNLKSLSVEQKEQKAFPPVAGPDLSEAIRQQQDAVLQVEEVLEHLESINNLYPSSTCKSLLKDHPEYRDEDFQFRLDVLNVWLNLTKGIGEKLQLMATVLGLVGIEDLNWPWVDFESPLLAQQAIREGVDTIIPCYINKEEDLYDFPSAISTPIAPRTNKQSKFVTFELDASSNTSSGATTPSASSAAMLSPSDSSTPHSLYRPGVPHSNSYTYVDFSTRTSLYR